MSTMTGADPDLLDSLAREMTGAAQQLRALEARVGTRVRQVPWLGRDADRVREEWMARHGRAVTVAASELEAAAAVVTANAVDQRQASVAAGGAIGGGVAGVAGPGGAGPGGAGDPNLLRPRSFSVGGAGELGPAEVEGTLSGSVMTGSVEGPEGEFTLADYELVNGRWELQSLAEASAQYAVAEAKADGKVGLGPAELAAEGSAFVGAKVDGEASVSIGPDRLAAAAGVSALVGATAAAEASAEAFGAKASVEGHVTAGLEFKANVDAEISYEKVKVKLELAAALGIGGGITPEFEFEPAEAVADVLELFGDD